MSENTPASTSSTSSSQATASAGSQPAETTTPNASNAGKSQNSSTGSAAPTAAGGNPPIQTGSTLSIRPLKELLAEKRARGPPPSQAPAKRAEVMDLSQITSTEAEPAATVTSEPAPGQVSDHFWSRLTRRILTLRPFHAPGVG
jgi:hypothetical protein